jgi:uncharacterized protein involved in exopolysaccharide biosynthesis
MDLFEKEKKETLEFFRVIIKNIRIVALFVLIACLVTLVVTFFTPKKYKSYAIIFPTESNSIEEVIRNPQFGYDVEADRLIQLLQSRNITDTIIKKFDLVKYYEINTKRADWHDKVKKKYEKDITFSRTIYMSVIIAARTKNPEMSAEIVNTIISLLNTERGKLLKKNVFLALDALQKEYYSLKNDLDSLGGIVGTLTKGHSGFSQVIQSDRYISLVLDKEQLTDNESVRALQLVINQYNLRLNWFYDVQNRLKNAKLMSERPLPSVYVIEDAIPSYKKVSPSYQINLMIAFAGGLVFISFFLFFYEKSKSFRVLTAS